MTPPDALSLAVADSETTSVFGTLPKGWARSTLGEIASINPQTAFENLADDDEIPFIPMAAVSEESGAIDASRRRTVGSARKGYVRFCEGDVIFAKITPCMENGKTAPVIGVPGGYAAGSTEFHVLRPAAVETRYLWYWLVRQAFRQEAARNMSGSAGQLRVPVDYLRNASIPVPPSAEQRRIVARIDELFAEIAEGEAALARARQGLDTWRRALLKAAVTGELTRDWRKTHRPAETAADVLDRIRAGHSSETRHVRGRRTTQTEPLDTSTLPELPRGWTWGRLSELGTFGRGKSKHRPRDDPRLYGGTTPFIQTGVVAGAGDYIQTFHQTYSDFGIAQSQIWPSGTLCITIAANIAKTAILTCEACFPDSVVGLVPDRGIDGYFVHMWIQTVQSRLEAFAPATAQKNINLEVLHNVAVPLPPMLEQREIVSRFRGALEAVTDCVKTAKSDETTAALRQSILKAAFEGRLVAQDPADEPASVLLARLRERTAQPPARRGPSRRRRQLPSPCLPGLEPAANKRVQ